MTPVASTFGAITMLSSADFTSQSIVIHITSIRTNNLFQIAEIVALAFVANGTKINDMKKDDIAAELETF
nr:hypothetical protein [Tanacetum cinerariifolium]